MHRLLDAGIEVLDPHGDAIEAALPQRRQMFVGGDPWIDLDGDLRIGPHGKGVGHDPVEALHLLGGQMGGRATAPVLLSRRARHADRPPHRLHLAGDALDVALGNARVVGDEPVAGAEVAQAAAEGNVHVDRETVLRIHIRPAQLIDELSGPVVLLPDRCGGVAGVARRGAVVAREDRLRVLEIQCEDLSAHPVSPPSDCAAATNARTPSTGVSGRQPWPRFRTWPRAGFAASAISRTRSAILSGGNASSAGSRFPWRLAREPASRAAAPISTARTHRDHVALGIQHCLDQMGRIVNVEDEGSSGPIQAGGDGAVHGQHEAAVLLVSERPRPGVEELDHLGAGVDLGVQVGDRHLRQAVEKRANHLGIPLQEPAERLELPGGITLPLHQIGRQGEGRSGKPDQRDPRSGQLAAEAAQDLEDIGHRHARVRLPEPRHLCGAADRIGDHRARRELQLHTHSHHGDEDVAEEDHRLGAHRAHGLE